MQVMLGVSLRARRDATLVIIMHVLFATILITYWCCPLGCDQGDNGVEEVSVTRTHVAVKHGNTEQCLGSAVVSGVHSFPASTGQLNSIACHNEQ